MPGISKLGPRGFVNLEPARESYYVKDKSRLTEALKWQREVSVPPGLRHFVGDHSMALGVGDNGSLESEHDLAAMVMDFIENGSAGQDFGCLSSDSDSGTSGIFKLGESIMALKTAMTLFESDLLRLIHVVIVSISETDLLCLREGICNVSCIRKLLVKQLRSYGYNAAVCKSKWKGSDKVPGGEYDYVDVILEGDESAPERLVIDIDFQSHFEIARPIASYVGILKSLPMVYVGGMEKLERMLGLMVEAAKFSLKQNSMPLPPWRTLGYLRSKWYSPYERTVGDTQSIFHRASINMDWRSTNPRPRQGQCSDHLRRLKASLLPDAESGRVIKPITIERNRGMMSNRRTRIFKA